MKYMLLIYGEEGGWTDAERQECYRESAQLAHELHEKGQFLGSAPLHPAATATCVRVRNSRPMITDGPFTEAREQLGGFFLVDAANLDEALAVAARIPAAARGTVEVRPVIEIPQLPQVSPAGLDFALAGSGQLSKQ